MRTPVSSSWSRSLVGVLGGVAGVLALGLALTAHAGEPAAQKKGPAAKKLGPAKGSMPAAHPPITDTSTVPTPQIREPPPGAGTGAKAITWTVPDGWVSVPPTSPLRRAQYKVPGKAGDGELVVFYFGPNEGGGALPNAQRWAGQFVNPDGRRGSETMKTQQRKFGTVDVLTVEAGGTYTGDMMSPGHRPNYKLLGAIARGPDANWFFKLVGPNETVEAERARFEALLNSLKAGK